MRTWEIPVVWQMWGIARIEAETIEEAKAKVFGPEVGLPENGSYLDDSIEIDEEGLDRPANN